MNSITLSFGNVVLIALGILLLLFSYRLMWFLGGLTERLIVFLTQIGFRGMAKGLLAILIGYDQRTYWKSRIILWNQVGVRFAILWGAALTIAFILFVLKMGNSISSISIVWLSIASAYLSIRAILYWITPNRSEGPTSFVQDVKERMNPNGWSPRQFVRRWDYLDELFAPPG